MIKLKIGRANHNAQELQGYLTESVVIRKDTTQNKSLNKGLVSKRVRTVVTQTRRDRVQEVSRMKKRTLHPISKNGRYNLRLPWVKGKCPKVC